MKKILLIFIIFLSFDLNAEDKNNYYLNYLEECSNPDLKHYLLEFGEDWDENDIDIFNSSNLNIDCLEKTFKLHLKNNPVKAWGREMNVPFNEIIIRKKETIKSVITYEKIIITSLFSQKCGEKCEFSNEVILIHNQQYWYIRGFNDAGIDSKFIDEDRMLITNFMTSHRRYYSFDINTGIINSLPWDFKESSLEIEN